VKEALAFGSIASGERDAVEKFFGDKVICSDCGATLDTYADKCSAPLDVPCLGFLAIEGFRLHVRRIAA
jgi:hypothetical protein